MRPVVSISNGESVNEVPSWLTDPVSVPEPYDLWPDLFPDTYQQCGVIAFSGRQEMGFDVTGFLQVTYGKAIDDEIRSPDSGEEPKV